MTALVMLGALGGALETARNAAIVLVVWCCGAVLAGGLLAAWLLRHPPQPRPRRRPYLVQVDPGELARAIGDDEDTATWTVPADGPEEAPK